jgi:serine/threonine protein kinase
MSAPASRIDRQDLIPGFRIQREIARGGMAEVYLADQLSLDRNVALKVLSAFDDAEQRTRFQRESRIIGGLNHRNIITIFDVGEAEGRFIWRWNFSAAATSPTGLAADRSISVRRSRLQPALAIAWRSCMRTASSTGM